MLFELFQIHLHAAQKGFSKSFAYGTKFNTVCIALSLLDLSFRLKKNLG